MRRALPVAATISELFVYGTLRPGESRWPYLEPYVVDDGWDDHVVGELFDTRRGYPAARFGGTLGGPVILGRTFSLLDASRADALELLDRIEGAVAGLYRRVVVTTGRGARAWAYEYGEGLDLHPIESGDWLAR